MSDFNHIWLDKPYNELTDKQLKAVADWHQGWGNKDQHRACVHMMALRNQLTAERERADKEALIHRDLREELFHSTQRNVRFKNELTAERERADRAEADAVEAWRQVHLFKAEAGGPDGFATWKDAAIDERLRRVKAETERADRAEAELAVLRNNQLGPVSEGPLKALGAWIADHTDDDTWPAAERYLNAALAERDALRERMARLVGAIACAKDLTTIMRMPNVEYVADAHNAAVAKLRTALEGK